MPFLACKNPRCSFAVRIFLSLLVLGLGTTGIQAAAIYVDGAAGKDQAAGGEDSPLRSIQSAINRAEVGDTVLVRPGIYFESVQIHKRGASGKPIVLKASEFGRGRVIVSGARKDVRTRATKWELFDKPTATYRLLHREGFPARMLYDGIDLFPYPDLPSLQAFQSPREPVARPRPRHGYTYDEAAGFLYVRLHADGKYGSIDPNQHDVAIAPVFAGGFDGTLIRKAADYGIGVLGEGPAHVVVDGFTFETPGVAGVYAQGSDVLVRNCWFRGCRTGVSGSYEEEFVDPAIGFDNFFNLKHSPQFLDTCAARVVVENCDFTQEPCLADVIEDYASLPDETDALVLKRGGFHKKGGVYALWNRKDSYNGGLPSEKFKYEIGIASRIGRDWIIRGNLIHDVFEGLSCHAVSGSQGLQVLDNIIQDASDDAIELEDHASGMVVRGNVFRNCFDTVSYQPLRGEPWPTGIVIAGNVIYNDEDDFYAGKGIPNSLFKWGITGKNWDLPFMKDHSKEVILPNGGVEIRDNAIFSPEGLLIKNVNSVKITGFRMHDNVIVAESLIGNRTEREQQGWAELMNFGGNFCAPDHAPNPGPGILTAGPGGALFDSPEALAGSLPAQAILRKAGLVKVLPKGTALKTLDAETFVVQRQFVFKLPKVGPRLP
jgi:hypothetical protein